MDWFTIVAVAVSAVALALTVVCERRARRASVRAAGYAEIAKEAAQQVSERRSGHRP